MRRPRVCIVRQQDVYELPVRREAEALVAAGYDVETLLMRYPDRRRNTTINGVRITSLPVRLHRTSKVRYIADYVSFLAFASAILTVRHLRRRYAVVQVNTMPDFLVYAAMIPKLLGARVLLYMKEPVPELAETLFGRSPTLVRILVGIEQRALRFADHAVTVTNELKQQFVERGAAESHISVVLNGVDAATLIPKGWSPPQSPEKDGFVVFCHGTIEERYGQDTIVEAVALLRDELPDLRFVLAGKGSYTATIAELADARGVGDIYRDEGFVSLERLADLLAAADVGVVAQKASSYSHLVQTNKMMDYWIFGLPVIASRLRSTAAEYDDDTLEYYEPGDARDLARAIRRLYHDPARREQLAQRGRKALERNGWETQRKTFLGIYTRLLRRDEKALVATRPD